MGKDKFVLLDNSDYLGYYLKKMKEEYRPIVLREQSRSYLESRGVSCIGIFDYLDSADLKDANKKALEAADSIISRIDSVNKDRYLKIFGTDQIQLFKVTVNYLFKRFIIAAFRLTRGLESILGNNKASEIVYIHDGKPQIFCGTLKQCGFFFPDDITWGILNNWKSDTKPFLRCLEASRRPNSDLFKVKDSGRIFENKLLAIKAFLSPVKKFLLSLGNKKMIIHPEKKTILFLYPFYDFSVLLDDSDFTESFNILTWRPDYNNSAVSDIHAPELDFNLPGFRSSDFSQSLDIKKLFLPLLERFYREKIADIVRYWDQAKAIQKKNRINTVFWGNSPHRYPAGIIKEFFRINQVPVCGMQHGGLNGSNHIGKLLFETEYNSCDNYFSYGFSADDLEEEARVYGSSVSSRVIPVGSLSLFRLLESLGSIPDSKKQMASVIYPLAVTSNEFFCDFEENYPWLFKLQKKIIDLLAEYAEQKIVIKFPVNGYLGHPLGLYIEGMYPGRFTVIDNISFTECLKKYQVDTIIIDRQSTPLNESIPLECNIVVYNDPDWCTLTEKARRILLKRAIVCGSEQEFLAGIKSCLEKRPENKDVLDRGFLNDYCVYQGNPKENIKKEILLLASRN